MSTKQPTLGTELEKFFKSNYNSPYNFAVKANFQTASLAYMLRKNSFTIQKIEELGTFDEKVIDVVIKYLLTKKKFKTGVFQERITQEEIKNLKTKISELQKDLIASNEKVLMYQSQLINK